MRSHASASYLREAIGSRTAEPELLQVMMSLFDGHDIPAVRWEGSRRPGYYKAPWLSQRLAMTAHLVGVAQVGVYPFRGVSPWSCSCVQDRHVCAGLGARYFCLDLDAHNGESDTEARVRAVLAVAWSLGVMPLVFSSRSGRGAHIYIFLDRSLPTTTLHAAGKHLARLAGITDRCDVIPSAQHYKGLGTLHALPLSPQWAPHGGGRLWNEMMQPVAAPQVPGYLWWADNNRTQAEVAMELAVGVPAAPASPVRQFIAPAAVLPPRTERPPATKGDEFIFQAMQKRHPQFRQALATLPTKWRGGRSARDAYLVSYMRRQGMTPSGIVESMRSLDGTKAAKRGEDYVWALVLAQEAHELPEEVPLAGEPLARRKAKQQRQEAPWSPWDARVAPPKSYEGFESPWWAPSVQERLTEAKGRLDGIVLAHLVDRYYRGLVCRRMFFASRRGLAKRLKAPARTIGNSLKRLVERFPDVLRCVPGVPHPTLRLAAGYYVPEHRHNDLVDWYIPSGRSQQGTLL